MPTRAAGNQYAQWKDCSRCGLRLMYSPKEGYTGQYRTAGPMPHVVNKAQEELRKNSDGKINGKLFKAKLDEITAREKQATMPDKAAKKAPKKRVEPANRVFVVNSNDSVNASSGSPTAGDEENEEKLDEKAAQVIKAMMEKQMAKQWRNLALKLLYPPVEKIIDKIRNEMSDDE